MLNDPEHDPERHIYLEILELLMSSTQIVLDLEKTMIKQPELFVYSTTILRSFYRCGGVVKPAMLLTRVGP
jgi:hypothetical protein